VKYRGKTYDLVSMNGTRLFDPAGHGVKSSGICRAWRGIVCIYAVHDRHLLLDALVFNLDGSAPPLFGVTPKPHEGWTSYFNAIYDGLAHPLPYSGGLLLGADDVDELCIPLTFHFAASYREIRELQFCRGELTEEGDRCEQLANLRRDLNSRLLDPSTAADRTKVERLTARCFSLEYRRLEW
jgi:hypothetical protein